MVLFYAEIEDMKEVLEMLLPDVAAQWKDLGIALKLPHGQVEAQTNLMGIVNEWLRGNGGPRDWKFLSEAVRGPLVKNPALADKIEKKYC